MLTRDAQWYPKDYITTDQYERWFARIETDGWQAATGALCADMDRLGQKRRAFERLALDESRADFQHIVPVAPDASVLDYGCGLGSISFGLAPHVGRLVGMDQSPYRARLLRRRAAARGHTHVTAVCGGNTARLPFPDDTFDLVVMNGVLEWLPLGQPGHPTGIHRRTVRELGRVVKPGGSLYLAIENRFGYRYLWGKPDSHGGRPLSYVTVLPRVLAGLYHRAATGTPYRTYLHSYRALRAMLEEVFPDVRFYYPFPSYNAYKYLLPLDEGAGAAIQHVLDHEPLPRRERWALTLLRRLRATAHLAQDFAIVATRQAVA